MGRPKRTINKPSRFRRSRRSSQQTQPENQQDSTDIVSTPSSASRKHPEKGGKCPKKSILNRRSARTSPRVINRSSSNNNDEDEDDEVIDEGRENDDDDGADQRGGNSSEGEDNEANEANDEAIDEENINCDRDRHVASRLLHDNNIAYAHIIVEDPPFSVSYVDRLGRRQKGEKKSNTVAKVIISHESITSITCPCEDESCKIPIKIGRFGALGRGRWSCPHCNSFRGIKNYNNGVEELSIKAFASHTAFKKHLQTKNCKKTRGIEEKRFSYKSALGPHICHFTDNPKFKETDDDGKEYFLCPKCSKKSMYQNRLKHCYTCFPSHGIELGSELE